MCLTFVAWGYMGSHLGKQRGIISTTVRHKSFTDCGPPWFSVQRYNFAWASAVSNWAQRVYGDSYESLMTSLNTEFWWATWSKPSAYTYNGELCSSSWSISYRSFWRWKINMKKVWIYQIILIMFKIESVLVITENSDFLPIGNVKESWWRNHFTCVCTYLHLFLLYLTQLLWHLFLLNTC